MDTTTKPAEGTAPESGHSYGMPLPRLRLTPDVSHGSLDGAWWPRCDALEPEPPALVGSSDPGVGTVTRVTVGRAVWPGAPRQVTAPGHVIEVALSDDAAEAHAITVDCGSVGRWELLVVPPHEPAGVITRLPTAAAPGNPLTAPRLLACAESGPDGQEAWGTEGGAGPR
ncbi:DUF5994 family protein [Streptomyces rubradiris]|uniref:Uncharacterized protein n=1 Tax=Streptomyces rubradiris TaxID=285531 RepID=A0ABQ3RJQ2_STRRR|nr:DUF5994 family protein [Streptomyces rubradiris]GHH08852.1 hypothetical protein GCM10018792_31190 [Streptomyces rubradiris]GHI56089.1 hypothetical protein Srubr_59350 [Streptomyces rubradiris]